MIFRQSPLLRILFPFVSGQYLAIHIAEPDDAGYLLFAGAFLCLLYILFFIVRLGWTLRWVHPCISIVLSAWLGYGVSWIHNESFRSSHFSKVESEILVVRLLEPPIRTAKAFKMKAEVQSIRASHSFKKVTGRLMLYMRDAEGLQYGDILFIRNNIQPVPSPLNPDEFNYAEYLSYKNIFHQAFIDKGHWMKVDSKCNSVVAFSFDLRSRLISILKVSVPDADIYSVGAALLVGYEADLEDGLMAAYASSGTLHVLSVSGMHVALIYKVLEWIFSFLFKLKKGRHAYYTIVIAAIWFYALLSGLSPSVMRASMMISFVIAGKWLSRTSGIVNAITVSCLLLFVINPSLIMEAGFRLSLLAVLGIVFIHPLLFRIYTPAGRMMYALWSIVSISISAQLATFPVGLYYFHQFPNLFIIANLLIIPATTVAIYAALALVIIYKVPLIGVLAAKITWAGIWFANAVAKIIHEIPYSVLNGVSISVFETWLIYLLVIILMLFLLRRQFRYLAALLIGLIIFSVMQLYENIIIAKQKTFAVFAVKGESVMAFANGRDYQLIADSTLTSNGRLAFHLQQHWWKRGWGHLYGESKTDSFLYRGNNIIGFNGSTILIADSAFCTSLNDGEMDVDYLVLSGNPRIGLKKLLTHVKTNMIIADGSNRPHQYRYWSEQANELNINMWNVMEQGAFIREW